MNTLCREICGTCVGLWVGMLLALVNSGDTAL